MNAEMNPEKTSTSRPRITSMQSKTQDNRPSFQDKIKQIKSIILQTVSGEKQREILTNLQELNDIYLIETQFNKGKNQNSKISEYQGKNYALQSKEKFGVSEKDILEVRDGGKIFKQIKMETQIKSKSPQRKVEDKKFMKFQPKKINKVQSITALGIIRKSNTHN